MSSSNDDKDTSSAAKSSGLLRFDRPLRVACVGGGQLGRMMALEAPRLNIDMCFLDALGTDAPAGRVVPSERIWKGALTDAAQISAMAMNDQGGPKADVVTVEIEHINVAALSELEQQGINVQPSSHVLGIIQDKFAQKQHLQQQSSSSLSSPSNPQQPTTIPLPPFVSTPSIQAIQDACQQLGLPLMLKTRRGGYDGRGNAVLKSSETSAIETALSELGIQDAAQQQTLDVYAEGWIDFECEVAVMVVRSANGTRETKSYPAVNAIQQDSICRVVLAPARTVPESVRMECQRIATRAVDCLGPGASGVFGVELFVTKQGQVLLNEIAPRPHNTGHYTQDACVTSQFENHLRAICGLPLGSTDMVVEAAAMVNVLGASTLEETVQSSNAAVSEMSRAVVHWYGKQGCRKGRKMGHINLTGDSHSELDADLGKLLALEGIPVSLLPLGKLESSPLVGIVMGSQSDLPTMHAAVDMLKKFGVLYEVDIVSAHRTPDKLMEYSRTAAGRGIRVIIAGAGGAAHLPGMIASMTPLPVIGVPVKTSTLSGVDSLYSIVQMPRGVPVATVAIGNSTNAGLLAVRILTTSRPELREKMKEYQNEMKEMVDDMSSRLLDLGSDAFLEQMDNKNKAVNV